VWFTLTEQDKIRLGDDTETNTRGAPPRGQAVRYPELSRRERRKQLAAASCCRE